MNNGTQKLDCILSKKIMVSAARCPKLEDDINTPVKYA